MTKEADRTRRWRERQKAEGKSSFTVVLSQEAREILAEEKMKTGESYAVIIEKALENFKRQGNTASVLRDYPRREGTLAKAAAKEHRPPATGDASPEGRRQPRILIDDLANYPSVEDMKQEIAGKEPIGIYDLKSNEGLITRLLRSSANPFGRKKKWFK